MDECLEGALSRKESGPPGSGKNKWSETLAHVIRVFTQYRGGLAAPELDRRGSRSGTWWWRGEAAV